MSANIYEKLEKEKDGKKLKITIQQVTPDLVEPVIQHMCNNFLGRELLCKHLNILNDPVSLQSFIHVWRKIMKDGAAIVALLDQGPESEPKVIGANITGITRKDTQFDELPGEAFKYIVGAVEQLKNEADIWERYGVDAYLNALGLSVDKNYHGMSLGGDLLRARRKVCERFDLPLTVTVFSAPEAQHLAAKDGFETIVEYTLKEFNFSMSNVFRNLDGKINIMVKKYV